MKNEIYVLADNQKVENNFCLYTSKSELSNYLNAVKFCGLLDTARLHLAPLATQQIGVSMFTKSPDEKKIVDKLLYAYAYDIMEDIEPNWWLSKMTDSVKLTLENTPQLFMYITEVYNKKYIPWLLENKKNCIYLESNEKTNDLHESEFIKKFPKLKLKQDFKVKNEEDLCEKELSKVAKFLTKIKKLNK